MTNDELSNIILEGRDWRSKLVEYDLDYSKTEWGLFYDGYKSCNQGQLQKQLQKTKANREKWIGIIKSKPLRPSFPWMKKIIKTAQHIFYETKWNDVSKKYETPSILKYGSPNTPTALTIILTRVSNIAEQVLCGYLQTCRLQFDIVSRYYEERKMALEIEQKTSHKKRAVEQIECPNCGAKVARTNISRHKKTNANCLSFNQMTNDEP